MNDLARVDFCNVHDQVDIYFVLVTSFLELSIVYSLLLYLCQYKFLIDIYT